MCLDITLIVRQTVLHVRTAVMDDEKEEVGEQSQLCPGESKSTEIIYFCMPQLKALQGCWTSNARILNCTAKYHADCGIIGAEV